MNRAQAAVVARAAAAAKRGTVQERFWRKVDKRGAEECWPWLASVRRKEEGYGAFWLDGRHQPANRVALLLSGRAVPAGMVACHRCDNPRCCNPSHLFVGTPGDNNADKVAKLRHARGQKHGCAKLSDAAVAEIVSSRPNGSKRLPNGMPALLAARFGVSRAYISALFSTRGKS